MKELILTRFGKQNAVVYNETLTIDVCIESNDPETIANQDSSIQINEGVDTNQILKPR